MKLLAAAFALFLSTTLAQAAPWKIDPDHSHLTFTVDNLGFSLTQGQFRKFEAEIDFDPENVETSSVSFVIDANSVDTRDEKRDQHLMSPDFFDAKQYPDVTFKSKKVTAKGDDFAVDGELSIRGVTKPLSVVVKKTGEGEFYGARIGYETSFTIKRRDFGMV